jgi:hypothetical protein
MNCAFLERGHDEDKDKANRDRSVDGGRDIGMFHEQLRAEAGI